MTLHEFSPGLWVAQSDYYQTNSGVFIRNGQAALIDPCMRRDEIDALAVFMRAQEVAPQWLILTHSHWDHVLGPERFPGVRTVAQARYLEAVAHDAAKIRAQVARWEAGAGQARSGDFVVPIPDQTFETEYDLPIDDCVLRLIHVPGHAADQLAVYEPGQGWLWASDILSDIEIPMVCDSLVAYERTLANLSLYDLRLLVPGHGRPTADPAEIHARLSVDRAYLEELHSRVGRVVERGASLGDAIHACTDMRYWNPAESAGPHRQNVESAYVELGGEVGPEPTGWQKSHN